MTHHFYSITIILMLYITHSFAEVKYLRSISGKAISIPCQTSDWDENEVLLVLWYRENSAVPFYKLDSRNRQLSKAKHILVSNDLSNRFFFDVSANSPVLRINPVLNHDEGEYRCRVDYKTKRTQSYSVFMEVFGPPQQVNIINEQGEGVEGVIGPYDEYASITLTCEARDGNPNPSVIWYQTGVLEVVVDSTYTINSTGLVRNELTLRKLDRQDYRMKLTCRASSNGLYEPIDKTVVVDLNLKPLSVEILTASTPLMAGVQNRFRCSSHGSRPAANIVWLIGEERLEQVINSVEDEGNGTNSVVTFVPEVKHDKQFLICQAINERMSDSLIETKITITVEFEPKINISFDTNYEPRDQVKEGDYVRLFCHVTANPPVYSIEWALNGKAIKDAKLLDDNQTLILKDIDKEQSGKYQCTASNTIGRTISDVLIIQVKYAPICRRGQQIYYNVVRNVMNKILCSVNANPEDDSLKFKWFVNTSIELFDLKTFEPLGDDLTTSVANYRPNTVMNFATILCLAENSMGSQREPCIIYLKIDNGPPEPVRHCDISNKSYSIIYVECMAGNSGGLIQTFHLEVYKLLSDQLHSNHSSSHPTFIVDNLSQDTVYNFVIYASNSKGNSFALTFPSIRLPTNEASSLSQKELNPLLNSLIGIVASIVILCLFVVAVIKIRAYLYEDEYKIHDKYDPNKRNSSYSDDLEDLEQETLMHSQRHETNQGLQGDNSGLSSFRKLTNRLKATKCKTYEVTGIGKYTKVMEIEPPKKSVQFAIFDEFLSEDMNGQTFNERAVDVEPSNSKQIQTDMEFIDSQGVDTIPEEVDQEQVSQKKMEPPMKKISRRDNLRKSRFFRKSFLRNSFRKTL